jgi:PilZ domain
LAAGPDLARLKGLFMRVSSYFRPGREDDVAFRAYVETQRPTVGEKRRSPRKKALLTGRIVCGEGELILPCTIQVISKSGARVELRTTQVLPENVYLFDLANKIAYECYIASVRNTGLGLEFVNTYPLAGLKGPELSFLRRIWVECVQ